MTVSFKTTTAQLRLIEQIAERAWGLGWLRESYENTMAIRMDLAAVHANGNPLRFAGLLAADDFNFAHDMSGICNCLDRKTGKLARNFSPRFSVPEAQAA